MEDRPSTHEDPHASGVIRLGVTLMVALPQDVQLEKKSGIITRLNKGLKVDGISYTSSTHKKVNDRSENCDTGAASRRIDDAN